MEDKALKVQQGRWKKCEEVIIAASYKSNPFPLLYSFDSSQKQTASTYQHPFYTVLESFHENERIKKKPLKNECCLIMPITWYNPGKQCPCSQHCILKFILSCCILHIHGPFGTYSPLTAKLIIAIQRRQKT